MKKILFLSIAVMMMCTASAQQSEHLEFKGVPIDGTLESFVEQLKKKGFEHLYTNDENNGAMLSGEFAGVPDCRIFVVRRKDKPVFKVAVVFSQEKTWAPLEKQYNKLKAMLTVKYGEPSHCEETKSLFPNDNYARMLQLQTEQCKFLSCFEVDNGGIELSIECVESIGYVCLSYYDRINQEQVLSDAYDDL